jgi:glycosyltransferase involved in cell wall biosynthesis
MSVSSLDFYVLIPCYNDHEGLLRSLQSIHYDTLKFAVLIVDDGSREPVQYAHLLPFLEKGFAIHILTLPNNQGIVKALNAGLQWLEEKKDFEFVARLDCGDICDANRFISQVQYLRRHAEIDLVGSWCIFKDFDTGFSYKYITPVVHKNILKEMHFKNVFIHPTVMWRAEVTKKAGMYPECFPHAEDYGFFYSVIQHGKTAILPEKLVTCAIRASGISWQHRKEQLKSRCRVVWFYGNNKLLAALGIIRLWFLMSIPNSLIVAIKRRVFRA